MQDDKPVNSPAVTMGKMRSLKKFVWTPIIVDDTAERAERRANRLKKVCDPLFNYLSTIDRVYYLARP